MSDLEQEKLKGMSFIEQRLLGEAFGFYTVPIKSALGQDKLEGISLKEQQLLEKTFTYSSSPISLLHNISGGIESKLKTLKKQTLFNYKKIISKTNEEDLELYLSETFINMLSGVTFFNQYLLQINMLLEKRTSENNKKQDYNAKLLETIFTHTNKFRGYSKFPNNLSSLSENLFLILEELTTDKKIIEKLKKISIIFILIEEFFRNHQAHGLTHSLVDFLRGVDNDIFPTYIFNEDHIKNFSLFSNLEHKLYFSCPKEEFMYFQSLISLKINQITEFQSQNNTVVLNEIVKNKILNLFGTPKLELDPQAKWKEAANPTIQLENSDTVLVNSDIIRAYFKYHSIEFNLDFQASSVGLVKNALALNVIKIDNKKIKNSKKIYIHPESLYHYFDKFISILEQVLLDKNNELTK